MTRCWETRPCDAGMQAECPHATRLMDRCPSKCAFAVCYLRHHERTSDPALVFDPHVDRAAAIKEMCMYCAFFIVNGPRIPESGTEG